MTNKLKQNIRYQKAHEKLCKEILPPSPFHRKLLRLDAKITDLSRHNDFIWKQMYERGFRPRIDNQNPEFFKDFELISQNQKAIESATRSIDRLEKQGHLLKDAQEVRYTLNVGRLSQSF